MCQDMIVLKIRNGHNNNFFQIILISQHFPTFPDFSRHFPTFPDFSRHFLTRRGMSGHVGDASGGPIICPVMIGRISCNLVLFPVVSLFRIRTARTQQMNMQQKVTIVL